jgi:hypothetical protein
MCVGGLDCPNVSLVRLGHADFFALVSHRRANTLSFPSFPLPTLTPCLAAVAFVDEEDAAVVAVACEDEVDFAVAAVVVVDQSRPRRPRQSSLRSYRSRTRR